MCALARRLPSLHLQQLFCLTMAHSHSFIFCICCSAWHLKRPLQEEMLPAVLYLRQMLSASASLLKRRRKAAAERCLAAWAALLQRVSGEKAKGASALLAKEHAVLSGHSTCERKGWAAPAGRRAAGGYRDGVV